MSKSEDPNCQAKACALQSCLNSNTYAPEKCDEHVRKLYECCQAMYDASQGKAESSACPKQRVVAQWMARHASSGL